MPLNVSRLFYEILTPINLLLQKRLKAEPFKNSAGNVLDDEHDVAPKPWGIEGVAALLYGFEDVSRHLVWRGQQQLG